MPSKCSHAICAANCWRRRCAASRVLAIDPGFRTGCKLAVLDETGNLLEDGVIYPHTPPQNKPRRSQSSLEELVRKHQVQVIAIGNGTACRETEEVVSELIADLDDRRHGRVRGAAAPRTGSRARSRCAAGCPKPSPPPVSEPEATPTPTPEAAAPTAEAGEAPPPPEAAAPAAETGEAAAAYRADAAAPEAAVAPAEPPPPPPNPLLGLPDAPPELAYVIVNEAGASVYSASPVGREEFPNFDATLRGTISIGRRLQDPLSELVKIDPQHVGVGLYQHDVSPKQLRESLDGVVESCVNTVGVDLNTASVPLLRHVSGLNQMVARDLVEHRKANGSFQSREQLMQVNGIGERGSCRRPASSRSAAAPIRSTAPGFIRRAIPSLGKCSTDLGFTPEDLLDRDSARGAAREAERGFARKRWPTRLQVGVPTLDDIFDALARPGRDPREDLPPPIFKKGVLKLEDLAAEHGTEGNGSQRGRFRRLHRYRTER